MRLLFSLRLAASILVLSTAYAQETINYGSISGRVTDPSGAVVADANVTARHNETNLTSVAVTDREGRFRLPYLRLGAYSITVHRQGFADVTFAHHRWSAFDLRPSLSKRRGVSHSRRKQRY